MAAAPPRRYSASLVVGALSVYAAALAVVATWPEHVDDGVPDLVGSLLRSVPDLTYNRLEFASNILLFAPLGVFGALLLRDGAVALFAVPLSGLGLSALVETIQTDFLPGRTGSTLDIIANTLGATFGCLAVVGLRALARRARGATASSPGSHR